MQKLVKTQKSTNNPMSIFGLIEENMELSHIHLAVQVSFYQLGMIRNCQKIKQLDFVQILN